MYPNDDERETGVRAAGGRRFVISDLDVSDRNDRNDETPAGGMRRQPEDEERETSWSRRPANVDGDGAAASQVDAGFERETKVHRAQPEPPMESVAWVYCTQGLRKGQFHQLKKRRNEFGRASDGDLIIEDEYASTHHGALLLEGETWKVFDFASANGTVLNGKRLGADIPNPAELNDGDRIGIGESEFVFKKI